MTKAAGQSALQGPTFKGSRVCVLFATRIGRRRQGVSVQLQVLGCRIIWNTENNFSYRNVFQNGVNSLSKMVIKTSKFCVAYGTNIVQGMYEETLDFQFQY